MEDHEIPDRQLSLWLPMTKLGGLARIGKAGEEIGELTAALNRCLIQGIEGREPVTGKLNKTWLEDEIADVRAMLLHVEQHFHLDTERMTAREVRKHEWKATWFKALDAIDEHQ